MCGVQCLSGDHDQVGVHSSRNVANSIHERLECLRPSQFCIYLPMNSWIVLSVSLSGDQACVDNYSSGKLAKSIHERLQWPRAL